MGAYLVLFPNARIKSLIIFFFIFFRDIPAKWLLGFWFVSQFFISPGSGVAWVAHVGGFVFGAFVGAAVPHATACPTAHPRYRPTERLRPSQVVAAISGRRRRASCRR